MKIHIIGCSGSGKTYLANALSKKYHIPHFDLDDIQWNNNGKGYGEKDHLMNEMRYYRKYYLIMMSG